MIDNNTYDLGKLQAYHYHTKDDISTDDKINRILVECWYPKFVPYEQCVILKCIYDICNHEDSVCCKCPESKSDIFGPLPLIYLTAKQSCSSDGDRLQSDILKSQQRYQRRYDDFLDKHLVLPYEDTIICLAFGGAKLITTPLQVVDQRAIVDQLDTLVTSASYFSVGYSNTIRLMRDNFESSYPTVYDSIELVNSLCRVLNTILSEKGMDFKYGDFKTTIVAIQAVVSRYGSCC